MARSNADRQAVLRSRRRQAWDLVRRLASALPRVSESRGREALLTVGKVRSHVGDLGQEDADLSLVCRYVEVLEGQGQLPLDD